MFENVFFSSTLHFRNKNYVYSVRFPPGRYRVKVNDQRGFAWHKRLVFTGDSGRSEWGKLSLEPTGSVGGVVAGSDSLSGGLV